MARPSRPDRAATSPEGESRAIAWLREFRPSGSALAVLALLVAALVVLAPSLKIYFEQRQQIARLEAEVADAQSQVDELGEEIARWEDPAYIEAQARDRLYYVFPGDYSYLVVGDDGAPEPTDELPISDEIQTTRVDWLRGLLGSVFEAGLTEQTPEQLGDEGKLDSPEQGAAG